MNKSKATGTAAETAVVRYLHTAGFPEAHRQPLAGSRDIGDVWVAPGIIAEVKYRREAYSDAQVDEWLDEAETERDNAGANECWLIVNRPGKASPGNWWLYRRVGFTWPMVLQYRMHEWVRHVR